MARLSDEFAGYPAAGVGNAARRKGNGRSTPYSSALQDRADELADIQRVVERARQFAFHDELTGLPNRALLVDRLQQAMELALRHRNRVALVLLDLDGFDGVDHAVGTDAGNRLLRHVASELKSCLRASDTVCRYGGAEFVVMLPAMDADIEGVTAMVRRIRAHLAASVAVDGLPVAVTFSAGLALYPGDGGNCVELLNRADAALYQAKANGERTQAES